MLALGDHRLSEYKKDELLKSGVQWKIMNKNVLPVIDRSVKGFCLEK